jgi:hypothetical protein
LPAVEQELDALRNELGRQIALRSEPLKSRLALARQTITGKPFRANVGCEAGRLSKRDTRVELDTFERRRRRGDLVLIEKCFPRGAAREARKPCTAQLQRDRHVARFMQKLRGRDVGVAPCILRAREGALEASGAQIRIEHVGAQRLVICRLDADRGSGIRGAKLLANGGVGAVGVGRRCDRNRRDEARGREGAHSTKPPAAVVLFHARRIHRRDSPALSHMGTQYWPKT